jgi:hypothetical protein
MSDLLTPLERQTTQIKLKSKPGQSVFVRTLTAREAGKFADQTIELGESGSHRFPAIELAAHLVDAEGKALFGEAEAEKFLDAISGADYKKLRRAITTLNSLTDDAVENTEKN